MLTRRQRQLLATIEEHQRLYGVTPSYEEMRLALGLGSKSGVHRLILALEERGHLRRLPNRARAVEIVRPLVEASRVPVARGDDGNGAAIFRPRFGQVGSEAPPSRSRGRRKEDLAVTSVPMCGRIAAGSPIEALAEVGRDIMVPAECVGDRAEHFALEVSGDSMRDAGIHDGDTVLIRKAETAGNGAIVVALIDGSEVTLKRLHTRKGSVALEAANPAYETRLYGADRIQVQGVLVGLIRRY
ncbi:transcriptional repressor LexA [Marinivivus vitaminiproducens]|uniref:transcriptional repressor LexA n=1 Tax=Marinivivus vitaminiproducens TaxID=3035935 RepID=UPI0027992D0E|nr:transcriptional repressor LexA [Geminicoccaceae bacterium SCSIO 64248]